MIKYQNKINQLILAVIIIITLPVLAEQPTVILEGKHDFTIDDVSANTVLNQGTIFYPFIHHGYQIKLDAEPVSGSPGSYMLTGKNNPNNKIQVRITGDGWIPDVKRPDIMTLVSNSDSDKFKIVLDKNPKIPVDTFTIIVRVIAIIN